MSSHIAGSVRIRPMQLGDIQAVQAIDRLSFNVPWPESAYRFEIRDNNLSWLWVAEGGANGRQEIIGLIVVWLIVDEAHIATIAVHPDHRSQKIGSLLLATALKEAILQGAQMSTLEVRAGNLPAQSLYQRFRFEVAGRRLRYYRDNQEDALIMTVSDLGEDYLNWLDEVVGPGT